jgi:hypothetical protein
MADFCVVSNEPVAREVRQMFPEKPLRIVPIMSGFGEPELNFAQDIDPHLWAMCGSSALVERSLGSFVAVHNKIPKWCAPQHLELIGGRKNSALTQLAASLPFSTEHYPEISANAASQLLRRCSFGWIDYFGDGKVPPGLIFKSSSFGAFCAHGIVPVFHHAEPPLQLHGDFLPGPFFLIETTTRLPAAAHLRRTREELNRWYHLHSASHVVARVCAGALQC